MRKLLAVALLLFASGASAETMLVVNQPFIPLTSSVATLGTTCLAAQTGFVYRVTDALLPALGVTVAGSGAVSVLVRCNGTNWLVGQ